MHGTFHRISDIILVILIKLVHILVENIRVRLDVLTHTNHKFLWLLLDECYFFIIGFFFFFVEIIVEVVFIVRILWFSFPLTHRW